MYFSGGSLKLILLHLTVTIIYALMHIFFYAFSLWPKAENRWQFLL